MGTCRRCVVTAYETPEIVDYGPIAEHTFTGPEGTRPIFDTKFGECERFS
jgi:hypothetical protein